MSILIFTLKELPLYKKVMIILLRYSMMEDYKVILIRK
nr:MAG TPA: hypothetical protein [Caudoviricetes sp.]DAK23072.1 MAG TPA: hypothetical protein [Caudoviricetes sp.]DAS61407.1 MAG TPA: hypothetical protein [Caudoviricetes sp.]